MQQEVDDVPSVKNRLKNGQIQSRAPEKALFYCAIFINYLGREYL